MQYQSRYKRLLALSLACLMFVTASGMSLDIHFCGGHIASLSFFGEAETCHDKALRQMSTCCAKKASIEKQAERISTCKKGCCDNATVFLKMDSDLIQPVFNSAEKTVEYSIREAIAFPKTGFTQVKPVSYLHYKPPLLDYDILILVQSFLL